MQTKTFTRRLLRQQSLLKFLFAIFSILAISQNANAQAYNFDNLTISARTIGGTTTTTLYDGTDDPTAVPPYDPYFDGADLGNGVQFDQAAGAGELKITAAAASLNTPNSGTVVNSSALFYRVYLSGAATVPAYTQQALNRTSATNFGSAVTFDANGLSLDLLNANTVLGGGTYVVEVVFASETTTSSRGVTTQRTVVDPGNVGGAGFRATFRVISPVNTPSGGTTTWRGTNNSTNWFLSTNWTNGVPNRNSNAIIPERQQGVLIVYPILDNSEVAEVNNLTLVGQSNSSRGELTVERASLVAFGNIRQNAGGLRGTVTQAPGVKDPTLNSTLVLAGDNQVITGRLSMSDVIIAGTGVKSITGILSPSNILSFEPTDAAMGVIAQSAFEDPGSMGTVTPVFDTTLQTLIDLGSTGTINRQAGFGETNVSYVKGVLRSDRPVNPAPQTFGNVGLDIAASYTSAVNVIVFRIVGDPLQSPTSTNGGTVSVPIKRQYLVDNALDSENPSFAGATLSFVFHYLDSADELNGIPENNLTMFRSRSNGPPYTPVFGTRDTNANTVTRAGLPSLTRFTLTLGDRENPLPVSLTGFAARRVSNDALVTWQTASEQNNKGYEVQVSTDGKTFRTLSFVASNTPNSTSVQAYSYTDREANKIGTRYYRLRQVDLNGTDAYFGPVLVSFDQQTTNVAARTVAYPNPFNSGDEVRLAVLSATAGKGQLRLSDMAGRTLREETIELNNGQSDVRVNGLNDLQAGTYLIRVVLPTGETQNTKLVKR